MLNFSLASLSLPLAVMLLVRVAQGFLIGGAVRSKNSASAVTRLALDLAIAVLCLWAVGSVFYPPVIEPDQWLTLSHLLGIADGSLGALAMLPVVLLATGVVHAATAERINAGPVLAIAGLLAGLVVPFLVRVEAAFRADGGLAVTDRGVAMAAVAGGAAALVLAWRVGARKGKFNRDLSVNFIPGHNVLIQMAGLLLLLVAFVATGSLAGQTLIGASAAMLAAAAFGRLRFGKVDSSLVIGGTVGGLCAVGAASAGTVTLAGITHLLPGYAAFLLGAVAGVVVAGAIIFVETRLRIDDLLGLATAHLVGGFLGLPVAGLLSSGSFTQRLAALGGNTVIALLALALGAAAAFLVAALLMSRLRVTETAEFDGADLTELDLNGYPDFQQNMIKSYHMREI